MLEHDNILVTVTDDPCKTHSNSYEEEEGSLMNREYDNYINVEDPSVTRN
jgi:hypothetical protein